MSISVACPCGRTFPMPEFAAGDTVHCRSCGKAVVVPGRPAAVPAAPAMPVSCGGCGRSYEGSRSECPVCRLPRGLGRRAAEDRLGTLAGDLARSFAWGFQGILPIALVSLAAGLVAGGIAFLSGFVYAGAGTLMLGVALGLAGWHYATLVPMLVLAARSGAARAIDFPELPSVAEIPDHLRIFVQSVAWFAAAFAPALAVAAAGAATGSFGLMLGALPLALASFPAWALGFLALAVHERLSAISPRAILRALARGGAGVLVPMLPMFAAFVAGLGAFGGLFYVLAHRAALTAGGGAVTIVASIVIALPVSCYFEVVFARMLGLLHYHRGELLGPAAPPAGEIGR